MRLEALLDIINRPNVSPDAKRLRRSKWLEAAKILAVDPSKAVRCPDRDDGFLRVHDEVFKDDPAMMERYLVCETCGSRNVLRMRVRG